MKSFWKNYGFSVLLIGGMVVGAVVGLVWGEGATVLQPVATLFLNLLFCCVVPLVFSSLVTAIAHLRDMATLRRILVMFFVGAFLTGLVGCSLMALGCLVIDPGAGVTIDLGAESELGAGVDIFSMLTVPAFFDLFSKDNLLALIVFSIIFAIALAMTGEKGEPVLSFLESVSDVVGKLIGIVMKAAPVGLGCYFAILMGTHGEQIVGPLSRSAVLYAVITLAFFAVIQTAYAFVGAGREGVRRWWKTCLPPMLTALGTQSSAAAIPPNMAQAKQLGIPAAISDLVIPLGANLHKDGVAMVQVVKIALVCSVLGLDFSDPSIFFAAIGLSVVGGVAMGAIPGGGYVAETLIITALGLPTAVFPIMVMLGTIMDPIETMVSVTGDTGLAMTISRLIEGKGWMDRSAAGTGAKCSEPSAKAAGDVVASNLSEANAAA